ncbi:Zn-ribbon domain-containing OB-fold protein [Streptomyces sp. NPDC090499]|jgi:uncharacterized OB-fold protein|uniref:Zn-ribbon domain-containing OB-fold protein n=1 Tax=unclassified Streptomyces TaxID=2593676 RepID=UPI0037FCAFDE
MPAPPRTKPVPIATPVTQEYWEATARHELLIQRCVTTGKTFTYPRRYSPYVVGGEVEWVRASGRGRLYSYVINNLPGPGYQDETPYVIAIVELAEGPRVLANLVDIEPTPGALRIDMPLEAVFEPRGELTIVQFRPEVSA